GQYGDLRRPLPRLGLKRKRFPEDILEDTLGDLRRLIHPGLPLSMWERVIAVVLYGTFWHIAYFTTAVFNAYSWPHDLSDDGILARLLALNLERAAGHGGGGPRQRGVATRLRCIIKHCHAERA